MAKRIIVLHEKKGRVPAHIAWELTIARTVRYLRISYISYHLIADLTKPSSRENNSSEITRCHLDQDSGRFLEQIYINSVMATSWFHIEPLPLFAERDSH